MSIAIIKTGFKTYEINGLKAMVVFDVAGFIYDVDCDPKIPEDHKKIFLDHVMTTSKKPSYFD